MKEKTKASPCRPVNKLFKNMKFNIQRDKNKRKELLIPHTI